MIFSSIEERQEFQRKPSILKKKGSGLKNYQEIKLTRRL